MREQKTKSPGAQSLGNRKAIAECSTTESISSQSAFVRNEAHGSGGTNDRHDYRFDLIPESFKDLPHWGVWRREYTDGKPNNVPYDAKTGNHIAVNDPGTWSPFALALEAYQRGIRGQWDGMNVVLKEGGQIVGLDVDECVDEGGDLTPEAREIVTLWGSYLEYSPSRRGLRGFAFGTLPAGRRKAGKLEIYDSGKVLTVTGWHLSGSPTTLETRPEAIREIHQQFFSKPKKHPATGTVNPNEYEPLTDDEVLDLATRAKNGARVQAVMDGDFAGYASISEADLAACNYLAFYCGPNSHEQIDRIFREHFAGFRPDKWNKRHFANGDSYGQGTIKTALEDRTEFYRRPHVGRAPQHEPLTEEEENEIALAQEREPQEEETDASMSEADIGTTAEPTNEPQAATGTGRTEYVVPDILWQGHFQLVAEKLKRKTWEVWVGTYGALSARAARNLHCFYFSGHVYGNTYCLLVNATGAGKDIIVNISRELLGSKYRIKVALNSGQALVPLLTEDSLISKGGHLTVKGVPCLLLSSEWSRIVQMSGIQHATLQEDLNDLFMRHYAWGTGRSHKSTTGGEIDITTPALTIVGMTTRKLFQGALTDKAIGSGLVNRYLILPGSATFEPYTGQDYDAAQVLPGLIDHLKTHTFGLGESMGTLYSPEAWKAFLVFQRDFIMPLHAEGTSTSETLARLHLHLQHVAALYAWQMRSRRIELDHFKAAKAVIEISHSFMLELLGERSKSFEPTKTQEVEAAIEQQIIARLRKRPGLTKRELARQMSQDKGGYIAKGNIVDALLRHGVLTTKPNGKRTELYALLRPKTTEGR